MWSDDVESGDNGWTPEVGTLADTTGAGWIRTTGTFDYEQYYLVEWRNYDGFDKGLLTPYSTNFTSNGEWNVNRTPYNAPGMLLWHRDAAYTFNASTTSSSTRRASAPRVRCCWWTPLRARAAEGRGR